MAVNPAAGFDKITPQEVKDAPPAAAGKEETMLKYPVFISAQHEDGRREQSNLKVVAASPDDAVERALQQYLPRFGGEDGWRIAAVVDELSVTAPKEEAGEST